MYKNIESEISSVLNIIKKHGCVPDDIEAPVFFKEKVAVLSSMLIFQNIELSPLQMAQKIDAIFKHLRSEIITTNNLEIPDDQSITDCYCEYIIATFYVCYEILGVKKSLVDEAQDYFLQNLKSVN